jgi:hypothetical protein
MLKTVNLLIESNIVEYGLISRSTYPKIFNQSVGSLIRVLLYQLHKYESTVTRIQDSVCEIAVGRSLNHVAVPT